jgi:pimeloyl-ACP methyl ester carboxylesterase
MTCIGRKVPWQGGGVMKQTCVFIHGLESTGRGTKGLYFSERYPGMIIEDFSGTFSRRVEKLETLLAGKGDLILVGSSYGGLMAAVYACLHEELVKKLVLLAPALHLEPYEPFLNKKLHMPIVIFHGCRDNVVPLPPIREIAGRLFPNHAFNAVDDDHSLHGTFAGLDWDALLSLP